MFEKLTYRQYILLKDKGDVDTIAQYVKADQNLYLNNKMYRPVYNPLSMMTFNEYIYLSSPPQQKKYISEQTKNLPAINIPFISFPLLYKIGTKDILKLKYFNVIATLKWIVEQMQLIKKAEDTIFSGNDLEWERAGGKDMSRFKHYNLINFVSNSDITKEAEVKQLPYYQILIYADFKKAQARIEKKMMDNARLKK